MIKQLGFSGLIFVKIYQEGINRFIVIYQLELVKNQWEFDRIMLRPLLLSGKNLDEKYQVVTEIMLKK